MKYKSTKSPRIQLDEDGLKRLGYVKYGKDDLKRNIWRLKVPYYHFEIQMVIGPYPKSNPNCGILSLYDAAKDIPGFTKAGKKKIYKSPERIIPIAWYVDTYERLRNIIISLTHQNI